MMNGVKHALVFIWGAGYASGVFLMRMPVIIPRLWMIPLVIFVAGTSLLIFALTINWFMDNWKSD